MYRELLPADHRRIIGIEAHEVPDVLLLVGLLSVHRGGERFAGYLENARLCPGIPAYLAEFRDLRVALASCFGGPMAANYAHMFCGCGVPAVIQLGWFGALQPGMALGDVIVPRHAERQDGVSDWYLAKGILADASEDLSDAIIGQLKDRSVPASRHAIYSTSALLAESRDVIADWSRHGYQGVDMETAATFAVAKSLGARRAAALIRLDDLISGEDSVAERMPRERTIFVRQRERVVVEAVLEAVTVLKQAGALKAK